MTQIVMHESLKVIIPPRPRNEMFIVAMGYYVLSFLVLLASFILQGFVLNLDITFEFSSICRINTSCLPLF